ncbi:MAG: restriction endonuclease subunit S [Candidatus Paceibacterota bacterium]
MTQVANYFNAAYGKVKDPFGDFVVGKIPFISSGDTDNGVVGFFDLKPMYKNVISVARTGSVGSSFYHPYSCVINSDCIVLEPKQKFTQEQMLVFVTLLRKNIYRYSYARKVTPERLLATEITDDFNHILKNINIAEKIRKLKKSKSDKKSSLSDEKWGQFNLGDLFTFEKGERLTKPDRIEGDIPLITAGENNNGVSQYISFEDFKDKKKIFENKITVDMFFNVFYHDYKYFSDDNIHTLIPIKFQLNKYSSLFLITILNKLKYKYAYGRQVRLMRLPLEKIKLPVDKNENLDWQFMENYIKSLPYSGAV